MSQHLHPWASRHWVELISWMVGTIPFYEFTLCWNLNRIFFNLRIECSLCLLGPSIYNSNRQDFSFVVREFSFISTWLKLQSLKLLLETNQFFFQPPCARSANQSHRPSWSHCWCEQEEVNLNSRTWTWTFWKNKSSDGTTLFSLLCFFGVESGFEWTHVFSCFQACFYRNLLVSLFVALISCRRNDSISQPVSNATNQETVKINKKSLRAAWLVFRMKLFPK